MLLCICTIQRESMSSRDECMYDDVTANAIKRTIEFQIEHEMAVDNSSKSNMARRTRTRLIQLGRLLDPNNDRYVGQGRFRRWLKFGSKFWGRTRLGVMT